MSVPYEQMDDDVETEGIQSNLIEYLDAGNIVDQIKKEDADKITADILELYGVAKRSMAPWLKKYKRAINLAKLQAMSGETEITEKNFPFDGASLAMLPYILEAMLDFSARASGELVWADKIVSNKIYGKKTPEKDARAKRVAEYSNYQLSEEIPEWREDQDKGLLILAAPGTFFKKTYYDSDEGQVCSELCLADEIIFDHNCQSFKKAPDKFQVCKYTRNEVIAFIRGEQGWDIDEDDLEEDKEDFEFIEAYTGIDLDDDGIKEPYIALIWKEKNKIVSLYPCYDEDTITEDEDGKIIKIKSVDRFTQYRFLPDPEGGPMGLGWGILLGPMFDGINTTARQLIDSGTLANTAANSGLISQSLASGRGNAAAAGPIDIELGQLTPVPNHGSGNLRDNIVQFPFAGPSVTLFQLMEYLITSARSMTSSAIAVEANPGEAASLYLARLKQGLKVPNSIIIRVHSCELEEIKKIAALNFKHYDDDKYNRIIDVDEQASMKADFDPSDCDIRMTSDPTQGSDFERVQRAQAVLEESVENKHINSWQATRDWLEVMNTPNIEELAPKPDPDAQDPKEQLMIAQMQMEAEMKQRDQTLREGELRVKEANAAKDAAQAMSELGLKADKTEAEITKMYTDALKNLFDVGIAPAQAMGQIKQIEAQFIKAEGGENAGQTQENNPIPI